LEGLVVKLWLFWITWGFDALICAITVGYFFFGLAKGLVASFNIGIWIAILAALTVILGGGLWLKMAGHPVLGTMLLLVLAVPALLCGFCLVLFVASGSTWN
jgi:hypothetical protein